MFRFRIARSLRFLARALVLPAVFALFFSSCSFMSRGRCYIDEPRYERMKQLFIATNSLQQVEQAMAAEGWSSCERNEFRYRLNKDLNLEVVPEPGTPAAELLP